MIAGTIILNDHTIHFDTDLEQGVALATVRDNHSGKTHTLQLPGETFAAALSMALHPGGHVVDQDVLDAVEVFKDVDNDLRFIP